MLTPFTKGTDMTSTAVRPAAQQAATMTSLRKTALIAGAFYLITFASSIPPVLFMLSPVLDDPGYIIGSGPDTQVLLACFLDMINALAAIGTAVALYSVVKRQHEGFALGFVTTRLMEAAVIMIGVISLLSVVTLRQDLAGTAGVDAASLVTTGQALVAIRDWTFLLGPAVMAALNAVLLGTLMYRSGLVPRVIPVIGLIGAPMLLASAIATFFGVHELDSAVHMIATGPIFVWELSLGIYLVVKGFKPSPITAAMTSADTPPANRDAVA
jgi:hypothetical protein